MAQLPMKAPGGPLTEAQAASILPLVFLTVTGSIPTKTQAENLLAQVWIETAGGKSLWQHNWGNLSASKGWVAQNDYWRPTWYTITEGSSARNKRLHEEMKKGQAPSAFRAYPDHEAGATAYVKLLNKARFRPILEGANESPEALAKAIFTTGYCPDPIECAPERTAPTLRRLAAGFQRRGVFDDMPPGGGPGGTAGPVKMGLATLIIVGSVSMLGWTLLKPKKRRVR